MNLWLWTFIGLLVITLIGAGLIEASIRVLKSKEDGPRSNRPAWWGWRIAGGGLVGIVIHIIAFICVNNIPTPLF